MREQLIAERATVIQQELTEWAAENSILQVGERLTFSIRIERIPTVVFDNDRDPLELSVRDIFTRKRLEEAGVPKECHARLIDGVLNECIDCNPTLRKFLEEHPDGRRMLLVPNFGKKSLKWFAHMLKAFGLPDTERYAC